MITRFDLYRIFFIELRKDNNRETFEIPFHPTSRDAPNIKE